MIDETSYEGVPVPTESKRLKNRWYRGLLCTATIPVAWLGRFCRPLLRRFRTSDRYARGLVIVLPGIESESFLNHAVVWGLDDGGWPGAIEIDDWTTGCTILFGYHLRGWRRNQGQASRIASRIVSYRSDFPGRPVYLIGHSGGGAIAVFVLEKLPRQSEVTAAILLAPALSPNYPLSNALPHTERGIWNFWSSWDMFFLGLGTVVLGTIDGRHQVCGGLLGFQQPGDLSAENRALYERKLHQVGYSVKMARAFHLGGHFGCVNRVFVSEYLAPLLHSDS
jgi:pimeloyl-ACP methyl ester carboxylesterase